MVQITPSNARPSGGGGKAAGAAIALIALAAAGAMWMRLRAGESEVDERTGARLAPKGET